MERIINWIKKMVRWILVLPVACISLYIVYGVIWVRTAHIPIPYFSYINEFMASQAAGFVFVYAGSYVTSGNGIFKVAKVPEKAVLISGLPFPLVQIY